MSDDTSLPPPANTPSKKLFLKMLTSLTECNKTINELTSARSSAAGVKRGIIKAFEGSGGDKAAVALLEMLSKLDDDERVSMLKTLGIYAGWAGVPMWVPPTEEQPQGGLFGDDDDQETRDLAGALKAAKIYAAGRGTQAAGGSRDDNPHAAGSEDYTTWDLGWLEVGGLPAPADCPQVASTERRPRRTASGDAVN